MYECRVFVRIVERAQIYVNNALSVYGSKALRGSIYKGDECLHMEFPLSDFLPLGGKSRSHYGELKEALLKMIHRVVEYESIDSAGKRYWQAASMVEHPRIDESRNVVSFDCQRWLMQYILDFSAGYSKYSLSSAMRIRNPNALRLYMLVAGQSSPQAYSIRFLRSLLGCEHIYSRDGDFIRRCVNPAAAELEKLGVNGFNVSLEQRGGKTSKLCKVVLSPVVREAAKVESSAARLPLSQMGSPALRDYLVHIGFSSRELGGLKVLINDFSKVDGWASRLDAIVERARRKGKNRGYIVNGMKGELAAWRKSKQVEKDLQSKAVEKKPFECKYLREEDRKKIAAALRRI